MCYGALAEKLVEPTDALDVALTCCPALFTVRLVVIGPALYVVVTLPVA